MTKEEFINGLRTALTGEIPDNEVYTNIRFYEDYINDKCKMEDEVAVFSQLGDPRLIAKTIIEAYQISHGPLYNNVKSNQTYQDADTRDWDVNEDRNSDYNNYDNTDQKKGNGNYGFRIGGNLTWYQKALLIIIILIVLTVIFVVGGFIIQLFFTVGLPMLMLYLVYKLIFRNRR